MPSGVADATPVGDLESRVEKLLEERKALELELASLRSAQRSAASGDLASQVETIAGIPVLLAKVDGASGDDLRAMVETAWAWHASRARG